MCVSCALYGNAIIVVFFPAGNATVAVRLNVDTSGRFSYVAQSYTHSVFTWFMTHMSHACLPTIHCYGVGLGLGFGLENKRGSKALLSLSWETWTSLVHVQQFMCNIVVQM